MNIKSIFAGAFAASIFSLTATGTPLIGDSLAKRPDPNIQTRWYSPENPTGETSELYKNWAQQTATDLGTVRTAIASTFPALQTIKPFS